MPCPERKIYLAYVEQAASREKKWTHLQCELIGERYAFAKTFGVRQDGASTGGGKPKKNVYWVPFVIKII